MLALKSQRTPHRPVEHATTLQHFPSEILDIIAAHILDSGLGQLDVLIPFSLVSRQFRESTLPFLFREVAHGVRDRLDHEDHGLLRQLRPHPHLLRHVQTLHVFTPRAIPGFTGSGDSADDVRRARAHRAADLQELRAVVPLMPQFHRIRLDCAMTTAAAIVELLDVPHNLQIIWDRRHSGPHQPHLVKLAIDVAEAAGRLHLALVGFRRPALRFQDSWVGNYSAIAPAVAVQIPITWFLPGTRNDTRSQAPLTRFPWRELHLHIGHDAHAFGPRNPDLSEIPWSNLRRLSITWVPGSPFNVFFRDICPSLGQLESLRLCDDFQEWDSPDPGTEAPDLAPFRIDFARMPKLRELELDGISNQIPIAALVGPHLRHLRLHYMDDRWSVYSPESQRTHGDILTAAKLAPNIERLELDVGYIHNLWHPTAIPGVDVDVEQYAFLNALSKFQSLRYLRLFPPFISKGSPRRARTLPPPLPLADDQVIRIFENLRGERPSLEILSIAAAWSFVNLDTMCWEVYKRGDRTFLKTTHRERNYEHRQVWIGQRRITSEIKRHAVPQPFLPEPPGWLLKGH